MSAAHLFLLAFDIGLPAGPRTNCCHYVCAHHLARLDSEVPLEGAQGRVRYLEFSLQAVGGLTRHRTKVA